MYSCSVFTFWAIDAVALHAPLTSSIFPAINVPELICWVVASSSAKLAEATTFTPVTDEEDAWA